VRRRERLRVVANEAVGPYTLLRVERGGLDPGIPGQFFMLEAPGRPLPRPMSLCQAPPGELSFLLEAIGPGTHALVSTQPGEEIHVFGPLGNGFRLDVLGADSAAPARRARGGSAGASGRTPLLVGGGIGVAPLPYLSERLNGPPAILGFRSAHHAEAATLVPKAEVVVEPTLVTEPLSDLVTQCYKVLACGPEPMLGAVRELAPDAQLAWEAPMACGYGACYGCSVEIDGVLQRLCVAGPVLEAGTPASWGAAGDAGPEGTVPRSTGPESTVPSAAPGVGGARLRRAGAVAGQGGEA
jgi:dihydroorotate dehydrogenase electron transfer subunit